MTVNESDPVIWRQCVRTVLPARELLMYSPPLRAICRRQLCWQIEVPADATDLTGQYMNPPPPLSDSKAAKRDKALAKQADNKKRKRGQKQQQKDATQVADTAAFKCADLHWQRRVFSEAWLALLRLPLTQVRCCTSLL
jgi:hypothetical protein